MEIIEQLLEDEEEVLSSCALWQQFIAWNSSTDEPHKGSVPGKAANMDRAFEAGHRRILEDYFWPQSMQRPGSALFGPVYSEDLFERRFRMPRCIFNTLYFKTRAASSYLRLGETPNCTGKKGASALQKVVAALRQLAYGACADAVDEYCRLSETTANLALKEFCKSTNDSFEAQYLHTPTTNDLRLIEERFASAGFPGCIGVVDCSGWTWENCPKALSGLLSGKDKVPKLKMEVICDLDLYIWHLFCGLPGTMNDINVMDVSPFFVDLLAGKFPPCNVNYSIGTEPFDWFYLLADGIYPRYKIFARPLSVPNGLAQRRYTTRLSAVRSSVERVFGVLLKQFGIIARPGRLWLSKDMNMILKTCVIIHNMVVTKRKSFYSGDGAGGITHIEDDDAPALSSSAVLTPIDRNLMTPFEEHLHNSNVADNVKDETEHFRLLNALVNIHSFSYN